MGNHQRRRCLHRTLAPATTAQVRDTRRVTLARNIIKNWLPAANGLLAIADAAVNLRLGVSIDAMVRCITVNASVDNHYDTLLAETEVNGYDFVLYAGPQWDNSTDGYYRGQGCSNPSSFILEVHVDIPHHQPEPLLEVPTQGRHGRHESSEHHHQHSPHPMISIG